MIGERQGSERTDIEQGGGQVANKAEAAKDFQLAPLRGQLWAIGLTLASSGRGPCGGCG